MMPRGITLPPLPPLPMGQRYVRITFPERWCYDTTEPLEPPTIMAARFAREAGLDVCIAREEDRATVAVYAIEPDSNNARAWERYRALRCSDARRV